MFTILKTAQSQIRKNTNHMMMVNKTTNFKKMDKSKKKGKSKGPNKAGTPGKSKKIGATADAECFFCKEKGHWKRNCKKYLVEKKNSANSSHSMSVIHGLDVFLANS